jgi:hypothetical protein
METRPDRLPADEGARRDDAEPRGANRVNAEAAPPAPSRVERRRLDPELLSEDHRSEARGEARGTRG